MRMRRFSTVREVLGKYEIYGAPVNPLAMNMYALRCLKSNSVAIVDSGTSSEAEFTDLVAWIESKTSKVTHLLQTHAHFDHILGVNSSLIKFTEAKLYLHTLEADNWNHSSVRAEGFGFQLDDKIPHLDTLSDRLIRLDNLNEVEVGEIKLHVGFTPGHSAGHVIFTSISDKFIFGGDLIFRGSCGRVDLPGSDVNQMSVSLRDVFDQFDDDYIIYPGHGPETTIGVERHDNQVISSMIN